MRTTDEQIAVWRNHALVDHDSALSLISDVLDALESERLRADEAEDRVAQVRDYVTANWPDASLLDGRDTLRDISRILRHNSQGER